jgi:hypothetical protein
MQKERLICESPVRLRDMSLQEKAEISSLKKSNDEHLNKIKMLTKEIEFTKQDNLSYESQIVELKDQVETEFNSNSIC